MKNENEILEKLDNVLEYIKGNFTNNEKNDALIISNEQLTKSNCMLAKMIETLINEKYTDSPFEAVMIKTYRGTPILIKDGKRIDTDRMTSFDISWSLFEKVEISVKSE